MENVVIIWWGPAGNTAAIYAARAELDPIMFEWLLAWWVAAWGQLTTTTEVENFPWYTSILGYDLMMKMRDQSLHSWARIETETVDAVDLSVWPFIVHVWSESIQTKAIIIATGATAKRMWVPGEEDYRQKWISACAVCDWGLPMYRNKILVVVWWGDVACEEALYLTKFASKVIMLIRRDEMRASKAMQERVLANDKIQIMRNTVLVSVQGDDSVMTGLTIENVKTMERQYLTASWLFYAIWHTPNTAFLNGQINLDEAGYIITKPWTSYTSVEGIFAAWDVQDHVYRQAITSAGSGCIAALDAERWLASKE